MMQALELRVPPLVVVAAAGMTLWLVAKVTPDLNFDFVGQNFTAVVLACAGLLFCIAGVLTFHRARTTTNPLKPEDTSSLVMGGVYRLSRNPMYVGFVLLLMGWGTFVGNPLGLLVIGVFVWYLTRFQIVPEERALRRMFGTQYEAYCRDVKRWI